MRRSISRTVVRGLAVAGLLLAAACTDRLPTESTVAPSGREVRTQIACTVSVADRAMRCTDPAPAGGGAQSVILGGQGAYVRLESGNVSYDAGTSAFSMDVSVQNLLSMQMGTPNGTTAAGVRVFFEQMPTATAGAGEVEIANADGEGTFTRAAQPYFEYPQILEPRGSSQPRPWRFTVPASVERFSFTVYVHTELPLEQGALRWKQEYGLASYCCEIFYDGVWGASPNHVWAVAFQQVLQYDGDRWTPVLNAGTFLWDVWGTSRYDVYVAGDSGKVWHYDGNRWAVRRSATGPHQVSGLWSAGAEVLAVGRYREGSDTHGLLLRSGNGGETWTEAISAVDGNRYFRDVFRTGDDIYVVGYDESPTGTQAGFIRHSRDGGATWSDTAIAGTPHSILYTVLADGDEVWAAGERRSGTSRTEVILHSTDGGATWTEAVLPSGTGSIHSLWRVPGGMIYATGGSGSNVLRYDGTSWSRIQLPMGAGWRGIWGSSDNDIHVVGQTGTALHWNGTSWRGVPSSMGSTSAFSGVAAADQMGVAVGSGFVYVDGVPERRGIIRFDPWGLGAWTNETVMADSSSFQDVWLADRSFGLAVGTRKGQDQPGGMVWRMTNTLNWVEATPASAQATPLSAVWGTGPSNAYAFGVRRGEPGSSLVVLRYQGTGWTETVVPYPGTHSPVITDAWGSSANDIYVVGHAQTPSGGWTGMDVESFVMRWNGSAWSIVAGVGDQRRLTGVWGTGGSVFVSGHAPSATSGRWNGFIRRSDDGGATWTDMPLTAPAGDGKVNGVYGSSLQAVYAVGSRGIVHQWDGAEWTTILGADLPDLYGITGYGREVLAVGNTGAVFRGTR